MNAKDKQTSARRNVNYDTEAASTSGKRNVRFIIAGIVVFALFILLLCSDTCANIWLICTDIGSQSASDLSHSDVESDNFVEDSEFSVDNMTDDVLGIGIALGDCTLLAQPQKDSAASGEVLTDATLFIYGAEGDYYLVGASDSDVRGYILAENVDTGGVPIVAPGGTQDTSDSTTEPTTEQEESTSAKQSSTTVKDYYNSSKTTTRGNSASTAATTTTTKKTGLSPEDFPVNSSPYFILVEKGSHTITIYAKDENGKYTREVRTYLTATGRTSSLTPIGLFKVGAKEKWHTWGTASYSPYCTKYYGGLFFHGPIYTAQNFGSLKENSVAGIGTNASSGCMRTSAQAAYFIYRYCPSGTYVKIVSGSPLGHSASRPSVDSQYIDPATGEVPVAGVSISPASATLKPGDTCTLKPVISPDQASEQACTWLSSNTSVATVSSKGVVTAKSAGTATITVTTVDGNYKATCTITVASNTTTSTAATTSATTTATTTTTEKSEPSAGDETTTAQTTTTAAETTTEATTVPTTAPTTTAATTTTTTTTTAAADEESTTQ